MTFSKKTGWWFPDNEKHLIGWMTHVNKVVDGRKAYQYHKYEACQPFIRDTKNICIDIGAHVGTWSYYMAQDFKQLIAFEPMKAHSDCWEKNVKSDNATLIKHAVGNENGFAYISTRTNGSSGDTGIDIEKGANSQRVLMLRIDDIELPDGVVDFVKIDCEGFELFVLQGMEKLLLKHKPCIIVEQKPETGGPALYGISNIAAVEYLIKLGAKKRKGIQGDYIMSWDK
jgi:FkbM family methyltransferase